MSTHVAVVWLDRHHAFVARNADGRPRIVEIERSFDAEPAYLSRVVDAAATSNRLVVMGPESARLAFEREYVALYQRPDRLVDIGQVVDPAQSDLLDQLRMLDPTVSRAFRS